MRPFSKMNEQPPFTASMDCPRTYLIRIHYISIHSAAVLLHFFTAVVLQLKVPYSVSIDTPIIYSLRIRPQASIYQVTFF